MQSCLDTEHNIWSSVFGVKGKIDALFQATIGSESVVTPFELKTGGDGFAGVGHRAQSILYSLMVADREGTGFVPPAILHYLRDNVMNAVLICALLSRWERAV